MPATSSPLTERFCSQSVLAVDQTKGREAAPYFHIGQMQAEIASYLRQTNRPFDEPLFLSSAAAASRRIAFIRCSAASSRHVGLMPPHPFWQAHVHYDVTREAASACECGAPLAAKHIGTTQRYIDLNANDEGGGGANLATSVWP